MDDGTGNYVDLTLNGYQMVGFASSTDIPGASVTASQSGQSVALSSVVLPQFQEVGPKGQNTPVDVQSGGVLRKSRRRFSSGPRAEASRLLPNAATVVAPGI